MLCIHMLRPPSAPTDSLTISRACWTFKCYVRCPPYFSNYLLTWQTWGLPSTSQLYMLYLDPLLSPPPLFVVVVVVVVVVVAAAAAACKYNTPWKCMEDLTPPLRLGIR